MKPYNIQTLSVDINGQQIPVQCFTIRKGNYNYQYAQAEINGEKVEGVSRFTNRNWEEYDYQKAIQNLKNNIGGNSLDECVKKRIDEITMPWSHRRKDKKASKTIEFVDFVWLKKERTDKDCNAFAGVARFKMIYDNEERFYTNEFIVRIAPYKKVTWKHIDYNENIKNKCGEILINLLEKYKNVPADTWIFKPITKNPMNAELNAFRNSHIYQDLKKEFGSNKEEKNKDKGQDTPMDFSLNESKYEGMDDSWSDIAVYAENQREIHDTLWNLKLALQKKMKRGEEINMDILTNSSIMRKIMQKAIREFNEYNKENDLPVMNLDNEAKQGLRQYFAEKIFDWIEEENINNMNESKLKRIIRQTINEAVNGGWEVETSEAQEAYNLAVNILGKETIDDAIIRAMGDTQLAEILAYVFRMYDFTEWEEYKNETLEPREPYADFGEMYESVEYEDYTPKISEIAEQCGYSITDSYDKWNGVVYVLDKEKPNACPETELKDKILSSIGEVEVKFGKRSSPQAPEMSKLLLYVETPYQEELA